MSKYLVIVESPTKSKTIYAILGKDYEVTSSMGHLVDLPAKKLAVDVEGDFTPSYRVIKGKEKIIEQLKKMAKDKEIIYLATDPDREGEAISWHIKEQLSKETSANNKKKTGKKKRASGAVNEKTKFQRVIFHEITEDALKEAFAHPTKLDMDKVEAQTARRVLDRVVGYSLSPLLWKKIVRGLSAGRVQSIALKFIAEREKEIEKFIPATTFSITAKFKAGEEEFSAKLEKYKAEKIIFDRKEAARQCIENIKKDNFCVGGITKKEMKRNPPPPYKTSLLQQDGFNKLRFSSQKTMVLAQKLYEGVEINDKTVGLITYMRTDSFQISPKAREEAQRFIKNKFGAEYLPEKEPRYKEKKGAQLAHEAIRPSSVYRDFSTLEAALAPDEMKLYTLIWQRFVSSLMKEAVYEITKVLITSPAAEFTADGRKLIFDGFLKTQGETLPENNLPSLRKGQKLNLEGLEINEHTTKPPPHFNDASLIKLLEEKGIGRPSTYAPTIYTLIIRNYIHKEKGYFVPTDLGIKVNELLVAHFPKIMDENFTALMEKELDEVAEGKLAWKKILKDFYPSFKEKVDQATKSIEKEVEYSGKICPQCGAKLIIKWSRRGKFLSCEAFPQCRYAETITTGIPCPDCKKGELISRKNRRGQMFYGCSKFPACRYTSRTLPSEQKEQTDNTNE